MASRRHPELPPGAEANSPIMICQPERGGRVSSAANGPASAPTTSNPPRLPRRQPPPQWAETLNILMALTCGPDCSQSGRRKPQEAAPEAKRSTSNPLQPKFSANFATAAPPQAHPIRGGTSEEANPGIRPSPCGRRCRRRMRGAPLRSSAS